MTRGFVLSQFGALLPQFFAEGQSQSLDLESVQADESVLQQDLLVVGQHLKVILEARDAVVQRVKDAVCELRRQTLADLNEFVEIHPVWILLEDSF